MGSIDVSRGVANYQETWKRNACCNCGHVKREAEPGDIGKATLSMCSASPSATSGSR